MAETNDKGVQTRAQKYVACVAVSLDEIKMFRFSRLLCYRRMLCAQRNIPGIDRASLLTLRYSSLSLSFSASMVDASSSSETLPAFLRFSNLSREDLPSSKAFERSTFTQNELGRDEGGHARANKQGLAQDSNEGIDAKDTDASNSKSHGQSTPGRGEKSRGQYAGPVHSWLIEQICIDMSPD